MNGIIKFIKQHPHCRKFVCPTCGGQIGFLQDLDLWISQENPDLKSMLYEPISLSELEEIQDWHVFFKLLIDKIPEPERPNLSVPIIIPLIEAYKLKLPEIQAAEQARAADERERFGIEDERRRERELRREREGEGRGKRQQELNELLPRLCNLSPMERLEAVLQENQFDVDEFPDDWATIEMDGFSNISSSEITRLIKLFDNRLHKKNSPWRELRTRLYRLRQNVYNREKGYKLNKELSEN